MKSFEFWFDFGSTASYLAWTQLPALEAATGATAVFKPMLLGGVFQATGNQSPANIPAKGKYIFADFSRFAKRYGVEFNMNPWFPVNTLLFMRGAIALQMKGDPRFKDYCRRRVQRHLGDVPEHERRRPSHHRHWSGPGSTPRR
jgi:2-hydroxychromene-2-carboxylate isomerase